MKVNNDDHRMGIEPLTWVGGGTPNESDIQNEVLYIYPDLLYFRTKMTTHV